jgi:hypothetical protein
MYKEAIYKEQILTSSVIDRDAITVEGKPSNSLWDTVYGLTSNFRQRQLHDEAMTCGTQPAHIRVTHRRFNDPASINDLDHTIDVLPSYQNYACAVVPCGFGGQLMCGHGPCGHSSRSRFRHRL